MREGDSALFMNKPDRKNNTGQFFNLPATRIELTEIRAINGEQGFLQGKLRIWADIAEIAQFLLLYFD